MDNDDQKLTRSYRMMNNDLNEVGGKSDMFSNIFFFVFLFNRYFEEHSEIS